MGLGALHGGLGMERLLQSSFAKSFRDQSCELDSTKQDWKENTHHFCVLLERGSRQ